MRVKAYCMDWHLSKSGAFHDLIIDPLQSRLDIELTDIKKWHPSPDVPQVFCQVAPPNALLENPRAKVVWVPMWDNVYGNTREWWRALPKHLRVVCFSKAAYEQAKAAGLPAIHLTYFKNPKSFKPVTWDGITIHYWNRTGLIGPQFLEKLCSSINADRLIFRPDIDPGVSQVMHYELPRKLGRSVVETVHELDKQEYLGVAQRANIYVAPRIVEGVGMTFVEAMARGAAVIAFDAPTMNEYLAHSRTGYLCDNLYSRQLITRTRNRARKLLLNQRLPYQLSDYQPWDKIKRLDWRAIGQRARAESQLGYQNWLNDLDSYYQFLTKW